VVEAFLRALLVGEVQRSWGTLPQP